MNNRLHARGAALVAALVVIALGVAYAIEIRRGVGSSVLIGKVKTVDETILLFSEAPPSTAGLTELEFGNVDIDTFGFVADTVRVPFWAANGGAQPFLLRIDVTQVVLLRAGEADRNLGTDALELVVVTMARGTPLGHRGMVMSPGWPPAALEASIRLLKSPEELGIETEDRISFTAVFRAEASAPVPPPKPIPQTALDFFDLWNTWCVEQDNPDVPCPLPEYVLSFVGFPTPVPPEVASMRFIEKWNSWCVDLSEVEIERRDIPCPLAK